MLTIIPKRQFEELIGKHIVEAKEKRVFDFDDFKRFMSGISEYGRNKTRINNYLKETDVAYVGDGSSRVVYIIRPGSVPDISAPCCLKVAKNPKGIAQNKAEVETIKKYKNLPCFPKLFDYDSSRNMFILCEVGTRCSNGFMLDYLHGWNRNVNATKYDSVDNVNTIRRGIRVPVVDGSALNNLIAQLAYRNPFLNYGFNERETSAVVKFAKTIAKDEFRYSSMAGLVEFSLMGGWDEVIPEDFYMYENWGVVIRENNEIPIPIDWGFTEEVYDEYYS